MTSAKFERIVSFSSEDPKFPANNLLKFGGKWKCKNPGEPNASVIIQLDQPRIIESIDIGNEHSAFIHVMVGRAASDDFVSILPASSFMSPLESDQSTNSNRVRMFTKQDFIEEVAKEKWDRIKLVCTQPFNKRIQYGLSFIVVKCPEERSLGHFHFKMKTEEDDIDILSPFHHKKGDLNGSVSLGSFLNVKGKNEKQDASASKPNDGEKSKDQSDSYQQNVTAIKQKNNVALMKQSPLPKNVDFSQAKDDSSKPKVDPSLQYNSPLPAKIKSPLTKPLTPNNGQNNKPLGKNTAKPFPNPAKKPAAQSSQPKRPLSDTKDHATSAKRGKPPVKRKPFSKLLEGVTIVISGYVNPMRSTLRSKALDMGAKYKQDWDNNTCTHLICAFQNTPKFKQVQGHGHIVQKDWIEQCHAKRKRFPWRRFALDVRDFQKPESEDEIEEEVASQVSASKYDPGGEVDTSYACRAESGSDTEEELEKLQKKKITPVPSSDPYLSDTEEEDDDNRPDTSHLPMPPLPT